MSQTSTKTISYALPIGLLCLPLIYPGLLQTSSDLLPKRLGLYLLVGVLCSLWLIQGRSRPQKTPLTTPAYIYIGINLLSLFWATNPFTGFVQAVQLTALLFIFLSIIHLYSDQHILPCAYAATLGGFCVAIVGILQYFGFAFTHMLSVGMPSSTFIFRNLAATYIIAILPLSLLAYANDKSPTRQPFWIIASFVMLLFLVYTRTRGAWLGFFISILVGFFLLFKNPHLRQQLWSRHSARYNKVCLISSLVLFCICASLPAHIPIGSVQTFDEQKTTALQTATSVMDAGGDRGRFKMWQHTLSMIQHNPILGVGLDNWEYHYPLYDAGDKITEHSEPVRPHNDLLWIASELGVVGLGAFLFMLGMAAQTGYRIFQSNNTLHQWVALTAIMGLTAWFVHSLLSFPKEQPVSAFLFWFYLALIGLCASTSTHKSSHTNFSPIIGLIVCLLGLYLNHKHVQFEQHYNQAQNFAKQQQWQQAIHHQKQAIKQGIFDHRGQFLLGRYYQTIQQNGPALQAYQKALLHHPNYAHTHHNLGGIYAAQKQWPQAVQSYQRALSLRPSYHQARVNLGRAYLEQGQSPKAIQAFQDAIQANANSDTAWLMLGATHLQSRNFAKAIPALKKATEINPQNVQALNNLALAYEWTSNRELAIATYQSLLKHWQGDPSYRNTIIQHIQTLTQEMP